MLAIVDERRESARAETNSSHVSSPGRPFSPIRAQSLRSVYGRSRASSLDRASWYIQPAI
ncbi:hypothetical protein Shyd_18690 [Streptomyces hydrogenans]|uniref:Uncharacterized protein n=1 Tax=Streptomyces hydrogenans TaxID=1873719 RepID=A0ABQ3P654_9ACTN|nr:hypothetical protein Shyd_18690 [Streptomyces hydrogenans]